MAALADICGCPVKVMEKAWIEMAPCFELIDGRLFNDKLEGMRTEQDMVRVKRIAAGRLGGIAKQVVADAKQVLPTDEQVTYSRAKQSRYRRTLTRPTVSRSHLLPHRERRQS
jgi:hypothetical protein